MVICYTCSGNERWDNGTTYLHLNGPNGTNIMQGSYDIESNGSCSMLTIKDAKPKDYVQQYQFTKGTTPITISPLSSPILSNQHIESCVDGLESYELNLTVKHNSEEAVFRVTEPKVELTMTKMEIVPGFYESKIHMLYRQNGNTSTTNESSNGQNVTIQLMYTTRKDSDIILTKQIADLKCPLILPGITEDASSTLIYILLPLVCIVMIVVVVIIYCKWEWIKIKFRKFRKKEPPVSDDELENLNSPTNEANSSNASANNQNGIITVHQNGINSSNARKKHQKGNKLST
ncbi:uncharacterized protein LOC143082645 [Mytilus galloprovincialis]|uniref:uncharacterized protein LOC143082645 n=1 Tax=Mytilus galloprovincialis TaxID=29158 RepID=UPI003F7BB1CF